MIPVNNLGGHFLNPAINKNRPIITAPLPEQLQILYEDTVSSGGPSRSRLVTFGTATVKLRNAVAIPQKFVVELNINGVHDIAMVDRIE